MKKILFVVLVFLNAFAYSQSHALIASNCCSANEGRCTGSASCTACTNCSRCQYCSNGGSCGVCAGAYSAPRKSSRRSGVKIVNSPTYTSAGATLSATMDGVNLRKGPDTKYDIIEKLDAYDTVTFLKKAGDWFYVEVDESHNKGYILSKYLE